MDVKDTGRQLSIAINLIVTMGAMFFFGFLASQYAFREIGFVRRAHMLTHSLTHSLSLASASCLG